MAGLLHDGQRIGNLHTPNFFLTILECDTAARCFCQQCRINKLEQMTLAGAENGIGWLKSTCLDALPVGRARRTNRVFETTLQQILCAKAYKDACLEGTGYTYWKSWAKTQHQFQIMDPKRFDQDATFIREANSVYDNWDKIVANLTDPRMSWIDARTFSVNYFYRAASIDWCLSHNEHVRPKVKLPEEEELPYDQAKLDQIFTYMVGTGIFDDIKHNSKLAAGIGESLKMRMIRHCRRHNPLQ